ncbi:hypothetical protein Bbelb_166920 [Branchiostoma belcheri]|nr:hypothetical protein Bbelb_166920 [Branchiostoma belcheri]
MGASVASTWLREAAGKVEIDQIERLERSGELTWCRTLYSLADQLPWTDLRAAAYAGDETENATQTSENSAACERRRRDGGSNGVLRAQDFDSPTKSHPCRYTSNALKHDKYVGRNHFQRPLRDESRLCSPTKPRGRVPSRERSSPWTAPLPACTHPNTADQPRAVRLTS